MVESFSKSALVLKGCGDWYRLNACRYMCHGREGALYGFLYMYVCIFTNAHVCFPFDEFNMGVLGVLNVIHTYLHLNS